MGHLSTYLADNLSRLDPQDLLFVKLLDKSPSVRSVDVVNLIEWWSAKGDTAESLITYLIRMNILAENSQFTFKLMSKGGVPNPDAIKLFTKFGIDKLERNRYNQHDCRHTAKQRPPTRRRPRDSAFAAVAGDEPDTDIRPASPADTAGSFRFRQINTLKINSGKDGGMIHATCPKLGSTMGHCVLTSLIGAGPQYYMLKGFHKELNHVVAIKLFASATDADTGTVRSCFQEEVDLLFGLKHKHIIETLDYSDDETNPYIVTQYVDGISLCNLIRQSGRLSEDRALKIALNTAKALKYIHDRRIVHGSVHPENIVISKQGHVKVSCGGIAKAPRPATSFGRKRRDSGHSFFPYITPEQGLNAKSVDHRSDIYSLGATLYHAVTGRLPFPGDSAQDMIDNHIHQPLISAALANPDVSQSVSELIDRMMAKNPNDRLQTADDVIDILNELSDNGPKPATPTRDKQDVLLTLPAR